MPILVRFVFFDRGDLAEHFARVKIAHLSLKRGGAKRAAHPASDLRGETNGVAIMVTHENAFDEVFILKREQKFGSSVPLGETLLKDGNRAIWQSGKFFSQRFG